MFIRGVIYPQMREIVHTVPMDPQPYIEPLIAPSTSVN
jgi:hypothetical protein